VAARLNQLFQLAPQSYLERTVLFTDGLASRETAALTANRLLHHVDIDPVNTRSQARILPGLHSYSDMPMVSYFVPLTGFAMAPKDDPPHCLVFLPEFTCCRLLVREDGDWLRLSLDHDLPSLLPPPENEIDSPFCDSINYWEFVTDDLVGRIRGTAVLIKEAAKPWRFVMQQIVGSPGAEVVRKTFSHDLRYSQELPKEAN
jgi:hypothetical protein